MDKSQLYSQIFIYVLSMMLVSFILVYGYNAIKNFKGKADEIACLKLQNDLRAAVDNIINDYGTVKRHDFELCNGYKQICFVESIDSPNLPANTDPIIKDSVISGSEKNVFLVEKIAEKSFYAGKISTEPDVLCMKPVSNKISLKLESRGNHVVLGRWQ